MIQIAKVLSQKIKNDKIEEDVLVYVFFILLSQVYYLIICLLIGSILGNTIAAVGFFLVFVILRRYAGGIHASTECRCIVTSTGMIIISLVCIQILIKNEWAGFWMLVGIAFMMICIISPVGSNEKPLSLRLRKINRIKAAGIAFVGFLIVIGCQRLQLKYSIGIAIIDEALLLVIGKIREGKF